MLKKPKHIEKVNPYYISPPSAKKTDPHIGLRKVAYNAEINKRQYVEHNGETYFSVCDNAELRGGWFHGWHECRWAEYKKEVYGEKTVALVECVDGSMIYVPPNNIRFVDEQGGGQ